MENLKTVIENEPKHIDVSSEFLSMSPSEFYEFLRKHRKKPSLSISIDYVDPETAIKLKAFLEDGPEKQERIATIRATQEQYDQMDPNVFMSGVEWERV